MKWIMLCAAIIVIAAGALLAPKFLTHPATTRTDAAATPASEKLTTSESASAVPEKRQNVQTAASASQPGEFAAETPKPEPKLEIREAEAEPKSEAKSEPKTEAQLETKPSTPISTHQAAAKPTKVAEPEPRQLAVVKQSGAAASHRQPPANNDEPPPAPAIPDTGSALVANTQPPEVLNGIVAPASPVSAPRTVSHIKAPRLLTATPPVYPAIAKQNRIQGDVTIDMEIDANGNVNSAKVLSGPPFLQAAARDAVHRWKYEPATLNDQPIPYHIQVKVHFALQ